MLERLQILVDGNAQGAIREFEKLGAAADRELGKTDDRLQKLSAGLTNFGAGLLAGSAVAAVGLSKLATSASDYGEAVNKATVILGGESVKQLEDFASAASKTAGISKTAALDAAAGFGALGKQAGLTGAPLAKFSTDLVQLAGDLASFNNTTVDESLQALKSGLQGETEPLKRFNIFLNDAALKQEFFALTGQEVTGVLTQQQKVVAANSLIFKQASDATGDFERTSDSLANQQRTLQAEFENLKTELGQGLVPVFSTVVGSVGKVTSAFSELDPGVQQTLGTLAGIGVIGAGALGGLSLIAGQAIKARDAFTTLGADGTRSLNNLGRAARLAGIAIAGVGVAFTLDALIKQSSDATQALDRFKAATDVEDRLGTLNTYGVELEGFLDKVTRFRGEEDFLRLEIDDEEVVYSLTNIDRALGELYKNQQFDDVRRGLDSLRDGLNNALDISPEARERVLAILGDYEGKLNDAGAAGRDAGDAAEGTASQFDAQGLAVEGATSAFQDYADALRATTDPFFAVIDATGDLQESQAKAAEAFAALADGATPEELLAFADAQRNVVGAAISLESTLAALRAQIDSGEISQEQAITTLDALAVRYPELAGAIAQVRNEFGLVGIAYNALGNQPPADLSFYTNAKETVKDLNAVAAALEVVATVAQTVATVQTFVAGFQEYTQGRDLNGNGIIGRQFGGPVQRSEPYIVGEAGPELFVPNTSGSIVPNNQLRSGEVNQTFNISSPDPILTASEVVRRQRDAEFLAGV